jgi:hypothetical protein
VRGGEEVEVFGPVDVPNPASRRTMNDHVQGVVVVGPVVVFELDVIVRGELESVHAPPPRKKGQDITQLLTLPVPGGIIRTA